MARASAWALVVGAAALAWAAKLLVLATLDASTGVFWGGFGLGVACAMGACATLARTAATGLGAWACAALFTALVSAPLARDVFAAVATEAPAKAPLYTLGAFVLTLVFLSVLRGTALRVSLWARTRWGRAQGAAALASRVVFPYTAVTLLEASTLAFAPLLSFAALPLPVPAARPWRGGEATEVHEANRVETALVVFVDPRFDDPRRIALSREAAEAPETFAASLGGAVLEALGRGDARGRVVTGAPWRGVTVVFPETFLNLEGSTFRTLWPALAERLGSLAVDGAVDVLMGARVGDANVVFSGARDVVTGRPLGGVVHAKDTFVPFYEAPLAGVSVRDADAAAPFDAASAEWLGDPSTGVAAAPMLASGRDRRARLTSLICYEALFPWRWPVGGDALVLTNHQPFARPGLASAIYDQTLRQLARASGTRVFLAANKGASGVFGGGGARGEGLAYTVVTLGAAR